MPKENHLPLDPAVKDRTIFISGLSYETTEETLNESFQSYGEIEKVNLPKYQDSQNNMGYCHVTFQTAESAQKALEMSGKVIDNRYLEIEMSRGAKSHTNDQVNIDAITSKTVFVKNLPYDCDEDEVGDFFAKCGDILEVRLVYNPVQKHFKGFGYVDFKDVSGAKMACEMSGKMLRGRPVKVDSEVKRAKQSYKPKIETNGNEKYNQGVINKKISKDSRDLKHRTVKDKVKNYNSGGNNKKDSFEGGYNGGFD